MSFPQFIFQRLRGINSEQVDEQCYRALIEYLRGDQPIDPGLRHAIAGSLEECWFPTPTSQREQQRRRTEAWCFSELIYWETAALKEKGERQPRTKAEEAVAAAFNLTVDALRKRITRHALPRHKKRDRLAEKLREGW